jgi:hypothetical protein
MICLCSRYATSIEYILQSMTSYDLQHINVLTYSEHKIWLEKHKDHSNIHTHIRIQIYCTYSYRTVYYRLLESSERYIPISLSHPNYTKPATSTMISMLCFYLFTKHLILVYFINIYCKWDFIILRHCKLYKLIQSFESEPEDGFWKLQHVAKIS